MSYPKDSSFIDMRSRIRTPVLKTRLILNELESMIKSPGQERRSLHELGSRRWISNTPHNATPRPQLTAHRRFAAIPTQSQDSIANNVSTPRPQFSAQRRLAAPIPTESQDSFVNFDPSMFKSPNTSNFEESYRSNTSFNETRNPKDLNDAQDNPKALGGQASIGMSRLANGISSRRWNTPYSATPRPQFTSKPSLNGEPEKTQTVPVTKSHTPVLKSVNKRKVDEGLKPNVFSAFDETKNPEEVAKLEKLQSLLNKELFRTLFNEEDTNMADEFKFDAPTVRGPRKRSAPVEDKQSELPAKVTKLTENTSATDSQTKNSAPVLSSITNAPLAQIPAFSLPKTPKWSCPTCMVQNEMDKEVCPCCQTAKPGSGNAEKPKTSKWDCPTCMVQNAADKEKCPCCETPKPGSGNAAAPNKPAESAFKPTTFAAPTNGPFSFGASAAKPDSQPFAFGAKPDSQPITFGAKTDSQPLAFGTKTDTQTAPSATKTDAQPFRFGAKPDAQPTTTADSQPFAFGSAPKRPLTDATPAPLFGSTTNGSTQATSLTNNIAPAAAEKPKVPTFELTVPANGAFSFGSSSATTEKSSDSQPFVFGSAPTTDSKPALFAPATNGGVQAPTNNLFSSAAGTETKTTTLDKPAVPSFGSTTVPANGGFSFGSTAPKTDAPAFAFGSASQPSTDAAKPTPFSFVPSTTSGIQAPGNMFSGAGSETKTETTGSEKPKVPFFGGSTATFPAPTNGGFSFGSTAATKTDAPTFAFGNASQQQPSSGPTPAPPAFVPLNSGGLQAPSLTSNPFAGSVGGASSIGRRKLVAARRKR